MRKAKKAKKGYILTDGKGTYGTQIFLADGVDESDFYSITIAEYNAIMESEATANESEE